MQDVKKNNKHGLGRGLDSLIPVDGNDEVKVQQAEEFVNVDLIDPNPMQPRQSFDEAPLAELAASIREYGIIQPLLVCKNGDRYQLIAGERRLRASKLAGLKEVPVIRRTLEDQEKLELAIIENVQRENLNPIESALSYKRLADEFNLTQEDISKKVGKARSTVANSIRLLTLPMEVKQGLMENKITEGHARTILALENREDQITLYHRITSDGLNVRATEAAIKRNLPSVKPETSKDPDVVLAEKRLSEATGTKVKIESKGKKGKVVIEYYNPEDLEKIFKLITS
jgi:ParB family chromosome partitioning protein